MKNENNHIKIKKRTLFFYGLIGVLGLGLVFSVFAGCGKLNDDSSQPSTPSGTSGYSPISYGPKSTTGTFTLEVAADQTSIPADKTNFTTITATLSNSSGLPVSGYSVTFTPDGIYGALGTSTTTAVSITTSAVTGVTNQSGVATVRMYGLKSGQATVTIKIAALDLTTTQTVTMVSGGTPSSAGNYSLEIAAYPSTVYANMADYATISATLTDSSGGSVENFTISFVSELGYMHNDPTPPSSPSTTASCLTSKKGSCSLYYYADRAGSAVISASVKVPDLPSPLETRVLITVLEGPGKPGNEVQGVFLTASPQTQVETADKTGTAEMKEVSLTATVWDSTGDVVGPNVRVEFSGDLTGYADTNAKGIAEIKFPARKATIGSHKYKVKACTYGINPGQTQYCDEISFGITVLSPDPETLTIELLPSPKEIQVQGSSAQVTAIVSYKNLPLSGATVNFTTTLGTLSATTATTNSFGQCQVSLAPGGTPGTATIYAVASATLPTGGTGGGTKSIEIPIISVPATVTVDPDPIAISVRLIYSSGAYTGTSPIDVLAIVEDASGNRIKGTEVTFSIMNRNGCSGITFDPPKSTSATTNAAGVAEPKMSITARNTNSTCTFQMEVVVGDGQGNRTRIVNGTVTAN